MVIYQERNNMPFAVVNAGAYGRQIIYTNKKDITAENIVEEVQKAMSIHSQNAVEIDYLDRYYRGDQPILYRQKNNRPEVNNKIVENLAMYIVESKTADMVGEPIQYVLRGTDEQKSEEISLLNSILESEDKAFADIELCRWRSICGTAYRYIGKNERNAIYDESDFYISTENPKYTFVVYYRTNFPAFSCQIRKEDDGSDIYLIFTEKQFFVIKKGEIIESGINGNGAIPVIEYPNNERRLSDIEITITMTDELNHMASERSNGIEQFVSSWIKFINCEVDAESFAKMRMEGALVVKSNNGNENKPDVDVMTTELNQTESQVAVCDLYDKLLVIQGLASRQDNSGGDTQGAVQLRNGHYDSEKRAELSEPIFKKAERNALRIILNRLRITNKLSLKLSDVEIHISRTKMDNMQVKATVLQILLQAGIKYDRAIKTIGLFSDPEQVAIESRKRMEILYPEEVTDGNEDGRNTQVSETIIEEN